MACKSCGKSGLMGYGKVKTNTNRSKAGPTEWTRPDKSASAQKSVSGIKERRPNKTSMKRG